MALRSTRNHPETTLRRLPAVVLGMILTAPTWAQEERPVPRQEPLPPELTSEEPPDLVALVRLAKELQAREPLRREAAIRRMSGHPGQAAGLVIEAFIKGNLQTRLACLELLREWRAPVQDLDPWEPGSLTEARLQQLRVWTPGAAPTELKALDAAQRAVLQQELTRLPRLNDAEAAACRERLARYGTVLLPLVREQVQAAMTDLARERLMALRYRLAAAHALALEWPGGLERLAGTNTAQRHQAMQELTTRATRREEPLLLELFSNPDPLVRELSLRTLRRCARSQATDALVQLLCDPEPNVRVAVLKELTEKPSPGMVPKLLEYLTTEKDVDLLVQTVRALAGAKGDAAAKSLKDLLSHSSWRVRAEAAEAIGKLIERDGSNEKVQQRNADLSVSLFQLLQDPDGFVASRALPALKSADLAVAVEPLIEATVKHPELTPEIVEILTHSSNMLPKALPALRRFCEHDLASVRAKAVKALCEQQGAGAVVEIHAALLDPSSAVREAALTALTATSQPAWVRRLKGPLQQFLNAVSLRERVLAAVNLIGLRENEPFPPLLRLLGAVQPALLGEATQVLDFREIGPALPILRQAVTAQPGLLSEAAQILPRLPWEKRSEVFEEFLKLARTPEAVASLAEHFGTGDPRAIEPLWRLLSKPEAHQASAWTLARAFTTAYLISDRNSLPGAERRQEIVKDLEQRLAKGPDFQRLLALYLLFNTDSFQCWEAASRLLVDVTNSAAVREEALKMYLLTSSNLAWQEAAIKALGNTEPAQRRLALGMLVKGRSSYTRVLDNQVHVQINESHGGRLPGQPIVPKIPDGLKPEMLYPFLREKNTDSAAYAAYLLCLLGEADGLPPLLSWWRDQREDQARTSLVYTAIAALGDDKNVRLLEEIYDGLTAEDDAMSYYLREFYWTIRIMEGPEALKLRKRIRDEVGMDALR